MVEWNKDIMWKNNLDKLNFPWKKAALQLLYDLQLSNRDLQSAKR